MTIWQIVDIKSSFIAASAFGLVLCGCETMVDRPETATEVLAYDFSHRSDANSNLDIVQVPQSVFSPEEIRISVETETTAEGEIITTQESRVEKNADGTEKVIALGPATDEIRLKLGDKWTIESLIGQINGRPVYAAKFMTSIEDRILRIVVEQPLTAQREIEKLITERFQQYVNNELIISEAEGMLTSEQKEGIFAWIQSLQEQTVAGYGGNRTSATQSLEDQFGMNMEQYLQEKRDEALAIDLLRRRVEPRTIVSWRDVERQYSMLEADLNPNPQMSIGRIRLPLTDELLIQDVQGRFMGGETFAQVAAVLKLPDGGLWEKYTLPENGIQGLDFADDIKKALLAVESGQVTAELNIKSWKTWYCVLDVQMQVSRSIFESALQRSIRRGLKDQRAAYERMRYLASLRDHWVTNDIDQMTKRLIVIAWERYLPKK